MCRYDNKIGLDCHHTGWPNPTNELSFPAFLLQRAGKIGREFIPCMHLYFLPAVGVMHAYSGSLPLLVFYAKDQ